MKGQNDVQVFIVIMVLSVIALIWAFVQMNDGKQMFDISETSSGYSVYQEEGGKNG